MGMFDHEFLDWAMKGVVAASFAGWALIIKYFGGKYINTMEDIQRDLAEIKLELAIMKSEANHHRAEGK